MTDSVDDLVRALLPEGRDRTRRGTAASASADGKVLVEIGASTWACTDLPHRPAAAGDTLVIREAGNAREVVRNITREKNPPEVEDVPDEADANPWTMTYILGFTAAGYTNSGFTSQDFQAALYAEYVKDEVNDLIDVVHAVRADLLYLQGVVNDLNATVAGLVDALRTQGVVS